MKTPQGSRQRQPTVQDTPLAKKQPGKRAGAGVVGSTPQQLVASQSKPKPSARVNRQPPVQKSRLKGWLATLGAIALLTASGGVVVGGIWLSILSMVNPNAVVWLNQFLPQWTRIPVAAKSPPKTLEAIYEEVTKSGLMPGEALALSKNGINDGSTALLLPIFKSQPSCQTDCEQVVELRVYQPTGSAGNQSYYQLLTRLSIVGPEEYFVLSSLLNIGSDDANSSHSLPLTELTRLDDKAPEQGFWFNLSGQRLNGDTPMTYGQVIHYNPDQMHLSIMLQWTSPNEQSLSWQQVTGDSTSELVINRTVGLEPHFKAYQLRPRNFVPNPIALEEISLTQPAIETQVYSNALLLARKGLWSPAVQLLQSQKKKKNWSATAQGQLDLIQLHAQVTASQAKQAWANPSTSILANLIDGRWEDALLVFQSSVPGAQAQDIVTLLKTDEGLWERVEAAIKVLPDDSNVKAWGALTMAAKQGRLKAIAWLTQLSKNNPVNFSQINELLDRLDSDFAKTFTASRHESRILGTAQAVLNVNPFEWMQPENPEAVEGEQGSISEPSTAAAENVLPDAGTNQQPRDSLSPSPLAQTAPNLQLEPLQIWYQVQVAAFHDGQQWWRAPFSNLSVPNALSAKHIWNYLGLDSDPHIEITVWTPEGRQEATVAKVKAVSVRDGVVQLLAAGEVLPSMKSAEAASKTGRLMAYTDAALQWIEPASSTLADLNQVQPQWASALLPALWRELTKSGRFMSEEQPSNRVLLNQMGQWSVRLVELTGNDEPDAVLTLYEDLSGVFKKLDAKRPIADSELYKPRTLIFSDTGALLYSEFSQDASNSLTAIADLGDGGPAALVVNDKSNYSLKRWSSQNKRFE